MGEIADMMLEGDLCEACGAALDGEGYGIPRYCSNECAKDRGYDGIASDGSGTYFKKKKRQPQDVISIKITYNGNKVLYATQNDSSFEVATDLAKRVEKCLTELDIKTRFKHSKMEK